MTRPLAPEATASRASGVVHLPTQRAAVGLDLTVASVHRVTGPGSLDFGGSEAEAAPLEEVAPELRHEDDSYGWWELEGGRYLVRYNEALEVEEGGWAHVLPLERLLRAGAAHAAFVVDGPRDPLETLLEVGAGGVRIKENARVSRLLLMEG